jgi:hypothetical protein
MNDFAKRFAIAAPRSPGDFTAEAFATKVAPTGFVVANE